MEVQLCPGLFAAGLPECCSYVQVSVAVPLTVAEVLFTPVPTVSCRLAGADAVMVTVPGILQVASPRLVIDTTATFDDDHDNPSPTTNIRL